MSLEQDQADIQDFLRGQSAARKSTAPIEKPDALTNPKASPAARETADDSYTIKLLERDPAQLTKSEISWLGKKVQEALRNPYL